MKFVDSRLARTLEDLAEFDFTIQYTPGRLNSAADALSRIKHIHPESSYSLPDNKLPEGITPWQEIPGGGDSLFEALTLVYNTIHPENQDKQILSSASLRKQLVGELINHPVKYGLPVNAKFKKQLKSMCYPGVLPIQEVIVAFSEMFRVTVFVHYGFGRPIVYRGVSSEYPGRIHLQCL